MISKNMMSSPLSCCINTSDRQNLNPVFKQQYVTEAGQIKMKMPISPMHYITNANFYAHDDRFPIRMEPNYGFYNEQRLHQNTRNLEFEHKNDMTKRMITPSVSFITQPRRNLSAHVVEPNKGSQNSINYILRNIDEKLSRIEFICKNNEEEIREIIQILKPKQQVDLNMNRTSTRLVPKNNQDAPINPTKDVDSVDFENNKKQENSINDNLLKYRIKSEKQKEMENDVGDKQVRLLTHHSLLNLSPEIVSRVEDKMFDVSEDLKNSNDMLENYIRNMKFEELADIENKLDVLSADYATLSINNNVEDKESDKAEDESMLSNIENKFRKLFTKFDSKSPKDGLNGKDSRDKQPSDHPSESIAVFDGLNTNENPNTPINGSKIHNPLTNLEGDIANSTNALATLKNAIANPKGNTTNFSTPSTTSKNAASGFKSEDLKLPSRKHKITTSDAFVTSPIKLTDKDMISILKGIDIPSKIKEANLTVEELIFLKELNKSVDDFNIDVNVKSKATMNGNNSNSTVNNDSSESSDNDFKCDLLAPTRVDFGPLLRDDSIHPLNSNSFD